MSTQKSSMLPWFIVGGLGLFVLFMLQFLIRGMGEDINLVGEDYYDKAQQYDQQMAVAKNTIEEAGDMKLLFDENSGILSLALPENIEQYSGTLTFYRPSNAALDFNMEVHPGQNRYNISNIAKGVWQLKLTVVTADNTYYKEKKVFIK